MAWQHLPLLPRNRLSASTHKVAYNHLKSTSRDLTSSSALLTSAGTRFTCSKHINMKAKHTYT